MELRQIEYFTAVVELKSFSLAAQRLFVTQPTITMAVKSLENELGVPLLDRSQRSISVTEAGEAFYRSAKSVLQELSAAVMQMEILRDKMNKAITVGVAVRSCSELLPKLLVNSKGPQPGFEIKMKELISPEIYQYVLEGQLDYGLCILPASIDERLGVKPLMKGYIRVLVSEKHPLARMDEIPLEEIVKENVFVFRHNDTKRIGMTEIIFSEACKEKGLKPCSITTMADSYTLMCMVSAGIGVCLMPDTSSSILLTMPGTVLKSIAFDKGCGEFTVGLIYTNRDAHPEITKRLLSMLKDIPNTLL